MPYQRSSALRGQRELPPPDAKSPAFWPGSSVRAEGPGDMPNRNRPRQESLLAYEGLPRDGISNDVLPRTVGPLTQALPPLAEEPQARSTARTCTGSPGPGRARTDWPCSARRGTQPARGPARIASPQATARVRTTRCRVPAFAITHDGELPRQGQRAPTGGPAPSPNASDLARRS